MAGLDAYASKRDFEKTPEPAPADGAGRGPLAFVVHKHAARALHYDLRLELDGVLKSWACPKGPSLDPAVKRLAVEVEDHPFDYRDFEGVIPEGNYGAGAAIVWDRGTYRHPSGKGGAEGEALLREGLRKGDLKFVLEGERLRGEFALVRTKRGQRSWLLLKKRDRFAGREEVLSANRSVVSGRTLEDLLGAGTGRPAARRRADRVRLRETLESEALEAAPLSPLPTSVRPMLAATAPEPFDDPEWVFEVKWDGYRVVAEVRDGEVTLRSRNLLSLNERFAPIAEALAACRFEAVLDGEVVVLDDRGHADFQRLQDYPRAGGHLVYYAFDLLHFAGHDVTGLPLVARKDLLKRILPASPRLRYSDHVAAHGVLFFRVARDKGLEGIVAKHGRSAYRPGTRSPQWLKVKATRTREAVVAGFTAPRGGRPHFGTLVLGAYRGEELVPIGHAGGGFDAGELAGVRGRLEPLIQERCPFGAVPRTNAPATWVRPVLVCEVAFSGWTREGFLRHPVYLRLREDKAAREVALDDGAPVSAHPGAPQGVRPVEEGDP